MLIETAAIALGLPGNGCLRDAIDERAKQRRVGVLERVQLDEVKVLLVPARREPTGQAPGDPALAGSPRPIQRDIGRLDPRADQCLKLVDEVVVREAVLLAGRECAVRDQSKLMYALPIGDAGHSRRGCGRPRSARY